MRELPQGLISFTVINASLHSEELDSKLSNIMPIAKTIRSTHIIHLGCDACDKVWCLRTPDLSEDFMGYAFVG